MVGMRSTSAGAPLLGLMLIGCYGGVSDEGAAVGTDGQTQGGTQSDVGDTDASDDPIPEVGCDGLRPQRAPLRRLSDWHYRNTVDDLFEGLVVPSDDFPATSTAFRFSSDPAANVVTDLAAEQLLIAAEDIGEQVIANVGDIAPCGGSAADETCAAAFIETFGPRALRRPLRDDERTLLLAAYQEGVAAYGHADGIGRIVTVALQLPAFVYLLEEGSQSDDGTLQLTDHEIASRLSYLLWGTMPDDELREFADSGELHQPEQIAEQARRMIGDSRSTMALTRFHREWLEIRELRAADKNLTRFPRFGPDMIASMDEQLSRLVQSVLESDDPTLVRLLTTTDVEIDAQLAPLYGLDAPVTWTTVSLDPERRGGILTLPAYLAAHSGTDSTSSVFRGLVIRERLLCQSLGSPPAEALEDTTVVPPNATERERTEALMDDPQCGFCHVLMNPLGMGFEHYDAIGAWRETYPDGGEIDTQWELAGTPDGVDDVEFDGAIELNALLAGSEPVAHCFVENWTHHSFGVAPAPTELSECALDDLSAEFLASGQSLPELIVAFTQTDGFRYRDISEEE